MAVRSYKSNVLAVDFGMSTVRAAVVDENGMALGTATRPSPFNPKSSRRETADSWAQAVMDVSAAALAKADKPIERVCVVGIGPVPVLLDGSGNVLDTGGLGQTPRETSQVGDALSPDHVLPYLLALQHREPALVTRATAVVDLVGYVVFCLTGAKSMDHVTAHYYTADQGLPVSAVPVTPATSLVGGLSPWAADRLGTEVGVPVMAGTIDCFADLRRAGVSRPGDAGLVLGSTLVIGMVGEPAIPSPGLDASPHLGEGTWFGGATASAGLSIDWIADLLGVDDAVAHSAGELDPGELLALPYLAGERTPFFDPRARGLIAGLTLETGPEHLYRAMIDGVAVTALDHLDHLVRSGLHPKRFRATGGGLRNRLLATCLCDALGLPLDLVPGDSPAAGAAWLALQSMGIELEVPVDEVLQPDIRHNRVYEELLVTSRQMWESSGEYVRRS